MARTSEVIFFDVEPRIATSQMWRERFLAFVGEHPEVLVNQDILRTAWWAETTRRREEGEW